MSPVNARHTASKHVVYWYASCRLCCVTNLMDHKWANRAPLPPMVANVVLCAWRLADLGPLLDSPAAWHYDAADHGRLHPGDEHPPPLQPSYAVGLHCPRCGRFRATGVSEAFARPLGATQQPLFCVRLNSATPVSVEMASLAIVKLGGMAQPRVVPVGWLQDTWCEPSPPQPGPPEEYASYPLRLPHDPLDHLQRSPPDVGQLRVVTASCGAPGSDPQKAPRLIAYLACAAPDIAHLQEASTQFADVWLAGQPDRVSVGPLFPVGGGGSPWCTAAC